MELEVIKPVDITYVFLKETIDGKYNFIISNFYIQKALYFLGKEKYLPDELYKLYDYNNFEAWMNGPVNYASYKLVHHYLFYSEEDNTELLDGYELMMKDTSKHNTLNKLVPIFIDIYTYILNVDKKQLNELSRDAAWVLARDGKKENEPSTTKLTSHIARDTKLRWEELETYSILN